jgi:hypothetical protein
MKLTKRNGAYFVSAFIVLILLFLLGLAYLLVNPAENSKLGQDLTFAGMILSGIAVVTSLVAIGLSIVVPDIKIELGDNHPANGFSMQEIRVMNVGNGMGDMASIFIEIDVSATSKVLFSGATGLSFDQTGNISKKQYRFTDIMNPKKLYPVADAWSNLGFISGPKDSDIPVKFSVQIIGTQGKTRKEFEFKV